MSCVCDFLTPGTRGAVTIKSHGGMSSPHTQKLARGIGRFQLFAKYLSLVDRYHAFEGIFMMGRPAQPSSRQLSDPDTARS